MDHLWRVGIRIKSKGGWLNREKTDRTSPVPDPMMRPVPTAPPREIMEIWDEGDIDMCWVRNWEGWAHLSGVKSSVEGLVALWVDASLIGDEAG